MEQPFSAHRAFTSPLQLWTAGIHSFSLSNLINITDVLDYNQYGIDFDGPLPEVETSNVVEVPQPEVTFKVSMTSNSILKFLGRV